MDNNTSKKALEGVLFVIGVLAVGVVAFPFLIIGFFSLLSFLEGDTRRVNEVFVSPNGTYQVESVNNSGGAMDQGESFLCLEFAEDGKEYSAEGNKPSKKAVEVKDIYGRYNTDYDIEWTSDSSFTVEWEVWDEVHFADVEIEGRTYTIVAEGYDKSASQCELFFIVTGTTTPYKQDNNSRSLHRPVHWGRPDRKPSFMSTK